MGAETENFIRFVAGVIVILILFLAIFTPEGIATNTYNYLTFIEPILLQDWLSTAVTVGSHVPGEFIASIKTSGNPHTIKIYTTNVTYVKVVPPQETYLKTKFATTEPAPVITNCEVPQIEIKLKQNIVQTIYVKKYMEDGKCIIAVDTSGKIPEKKQGVQPPPEEECFCGEWKRVEEAVCGEPPCDPNEVKYRRICDPPDCPPSCCIDNLGNETCIQDPLCGLPFDFNISVNPDNGVVEKGLDISSTINVSLESGVAELVSLSTPNLPSGITSLFHPPNYYPPGTSTMKLNTSSTTPKGTHIITIKGNSSTLERTTEYNLTVIETGGCCPHVSISAPNSVNAGQIFTVTLTYNHDQGNGGGIHIHWPNDKAQLVSFVGSNDSIYLPSSFNPPIMNGYDLVECGKDDSRLFPGGTCNVTLKALGGDIDLYYRAWDWTNDNPCSTERNNKYDYDRDPISGTCSINCDMFPDDIISCESYDYKISVNIPSATYTRSCICSRVFCISSADPCTSGCSEAGICGPPICPTPLPHSHLVSNDCLGCTEPIPTGCKGCIGTMCKSFGGFCINLGGSCKYECDTGYVWNGTACIEAAICGNNVKEGDEECDGTDLGGKDCTDLGYTGGTLTCNPDCTFNTSGCTSGGGGGCLIKGSKILTPNGFKSIEDIEIGDTVIGYENGKEVETKVTNKTVHFGFWDIYYYKGYWFTWSHQVYPSLNEKEIGIPFISNITKVFVGKVYNIETGTHNYFGENGLLIHNWVVVK